MLFLSRIGMNFSACSNKSNDNFTSNSKQMKTKIINTNFTQKHYPSDIEFIL